MNGKNRISIVMAVLSLIVVFCAHQIEVGQERVADKSGDRPDWLNQPSIEKAEGYYFVGVMTGANNQSFGMKQAHADGMTHLFDLLSNRGQNIVSQAREGTNVGDDVAGIYSKFAVGWIADNINFGGITAPESYWEKVEKKTDMGYEYTYNCYERLFLSQANFRRIMTDGFQQAKKKSQEENNKQAEEMVDKVIERLMNP